MAILFIVLDLAIALLLRKLAEAYQNRQQALRPAGAPFAISPDLVMILYAPVPIRVSRSQAHPN